MKKFNKILTICLCMLFVVTSVMTGFYIFGDKKAPDTSGNTNNNESGVVTPETPDTYDNMIYYASEEEETGAVYAERSEKGGAIYVGDGSVFTLDNGSLTNHESKYGGAIYVANGGTFVMKGGTLEYNYSKYGGAVYVEKGGTCNIEGGYIINNGAENAPAIYVEDGAILNIYNASTTIDVNKIVNFGPVDINFYVDGILTKTVTQNVPVLNLNNVPLNYAECNGYFLDEKMSKSIVRGDEITGDICNVYTKTATLDCLTILNGEITAVQSVDEVVVPRQFENIDVTSMADSLFASSTVKKVYLPATIENIPASAFKGCSNLSYVNVTDNVKNIGNYAFANCTSLTEINLTDSINTLGNYFIDGTPIDEINLPLNVTQIGEYTFYRHSTLKTLYIPLNAKLNNIGPRAFQLTAVENINLENATNLISIGEYCFNKSNVKELILQDSVINIGEHMASASYSLLIARIPKYITDLASNIFREDTLLSEVIIPEGSQLINLGYAPFDGCTSLEILNLENAPNIQSIRTYGFRNTKLKSIYMPENFITIGGNSFTTNNLEEIILPKNLETLPASWFANTPNLKRVVIPEGSNLSTIEAATFKSKKIEYINLENATKLTSLSENLFYDCTNLPSITLPNNLTTIGNSVFYNCSKLTELVVPDSVTTIGTNVFSSSGLKKVTLGKKIKTISSSLFKNCSHLQEVLLVEGSLLETIGSSAFANLPIKSINLELATNLTKINSNAFSYCNLLGEITLPDNVTTLGEEAFAYSGIESVVLPKNLVEFTTKYVFSNCISLETVFIPTGSLLKNLGSGTFMNSGIQSINLENATNLTEIGHSCFLGTLSLKTLVLPNTVTTLATKSFESSGIQQITFSKNIADLKSQVFNNCKSLKNVIIPIGSALTELGNYAFSESSLQSINLENATKLLRIGLGTFENCTSLSSIFIPATVTNLRYLSFSGCRNLTSVTFEENSAVTDLDGSAFENCERLTSIQLPQKLERIRSYCFNGTGLTNIALPASILRVGQNAFNTCSKITFADTSYVWYAALDSDYSYDDGIEVDITDPVANAVHMGVDNAELTYMRSEYERVSGYAISKDTMLGYHYLPYGSFPQTYVGDEMNTTLETWYQGSNLTVEKEYFIDENYMDDNITWNSYLYTDGRYYARGVSRPSSKNEEGLTYSNGESVKGEEQVVWFKVEKIKWLIENYDSVKNGSATTISLLSASVLTAGIFDRGLIQGYTYSYIETWLDNNFYSSAFSDDERDNINLTTNKNVSYREYEDGSHFLHYTMEYGNSSYNTQNYIYLPEQNSKYNNIECTYTDFALSNRLLYNKDYCDGVTFVSRTIYLAYDAEDDEGHDEIQIYIYNTDSIYGINEVGIRPVMQLIIEK